MQTVLAGYYDGKGVVFDEPLDIPRGQKVIVKVLEENVSEKKTVGDNFFGALRKYADESLIEKEKSAWANAAAQKHRGLNESN